MRILLSVFPIAVLVAYSQIMVKWRTSTLGVSVLENASNWDRIIQYVLDPLVLSAYIAALMASFVWLFVVAKLPLTIAFPVYIGVTFILVMMGGWVFLSETISLTRLLAASLILAGVAIGVKS